MTFDLGASLFPTSNRDNYGHLWGIFEYDWLWNIGDRTALVSNGWFEPESGGPRVFNFGSILGRPDGTNFYLGYRHIDPLLSRSVVATLNYRFNQKYNISGTTVWDFGINQQVYALGITRTGTDMQITMGVSYNSVLKNFGLQFEIIPNLLRTNHFAPGQVGVTSPFTPVGR